MKNTNPTTIDSCPPSALRTTSKPVTWLRNLSADYLRRYEGSPQTIHGFHRGYYVCHDRRDPNQPMDALSFDIERSVKQLEQLKNNPLVVYAATLEYLKEKTPEVGTIAYERISQIGNRAVLDLYVCTSISEMEALITVRFHQHVQQHIYSPLAEKIDATILATGSDYGLMRQCHFRVAAEPLGEPRQFPEGH